MHLQVPAYPQEENPKAASAQTTKRKACCVRIGRRDKTQKPDLNRNGIAAVCLITGRDRYGGNPSHKTARREEGERHVGMGSATSCVHQSIRNNAAKGQIP